MKQKMVVADTLKGLASTVNRMFGEDWLWVEGGGSVSIAEASGSYYGGTHATGGFWAVLEKSEDDAGDAQMGFTLPDASDEGERLG